MPEMNNDEVANFVASLTEDDLRERSQQLHEVQSEWEDLAHMSIAKMPCPECYGAGQVQGGSLGDICVRCMGARVVDQPGQAFEMPPFDDMRAAITAYGSYLLRLRDPETAKRLAPGDGMVSNASPDPRGIVTSAQLEELRGQARSRVAKLQLAGAPGLAPVALAEPQRATGLLGDGDLGDVEDADLDAIEDGSK